MNKFTQTTVSYKGEDVNGLALPYSVQRITEKDVPNGYVSIGKQQFGKGLRICFIEESLISKTEPRQLKDNEKWVSGYKTNLDIEDAKQRLIETTKECYAKDNSDEHKAWLLNASKNNMGLNSYPEIAEQLVNENWK